MVKKQQTAVWILYKNWRDQTSWRHVKPVRVWFGRTQYHPEDQWFLDAIDLQKKVPRSFAMKDIARWQDERPHAKWERGHDDRAP